MKHIVISLADVFRFNEYWHTPEGQKYSDYLMHQGVEELTCLELLAQKAHVPEEAAIYWADWSPVDAEWVTEESIKDEILLDTMLAIKEFTGYTDDQINALSQVELEAIADEIRDYEYMCYLDDMAELELADALGYIY